MKFSALNYELPLLLYGIFSPLKYRSRTTWIANKNDWVLSKENLTSKVRNRYGLQDIHAFNDFNIFNFEFSQSYSHWTGAETTENPVQIDGVVPF